MGKKCTITWYILHILLSQIKKFEITRKNDAFVAKIVNTRLTKGFMAIFAPAESLPSPATLVMYVFFVSYVPNVMYVLFVSYVLNVLHVSYMPYVPNPMCIFFMSCRPTRK